MPVLTEELIEAGRSRWGTMKNMQWRILGLFPPYEPDPVTRLVGRDVPDRIYELFLMARTRPVQASERFDAWLRRQKKAITDQANLPRLLAEMCGRPVGQRIEGERVTVWINGSAFEAAMHMRYGWVMQVGERIHAKAVGNVAYEDHAKRSVNTTVMAAFAASMEAVDRAHEAGLNVGRVDVCTDNDIVFRMLAGVARPHTPTGVALLAQGREAFAHTLVTGGLNGVLRTKGELGPLHEWVARAADDDECAADLLVADGGRMSVTPRAVGAAAG